MKPVGFIKCKHETVPWVSVFSCLIFNPKLYKRRVVKYVPERGAPVINRLVLCGIIIS